MSTFNVMLLILSCLSVAINVVLLVSILLGNRLLLAMTARMCVSNQMDFAVVYRRLRGPDAVHAVQQRVPPEAIAVLRRELGAGYEPWLSRLERDVIEDTRKA